MRRVRCHECGKRYDFDVDDFCPKCGAFNQPVRKSRISADGSVVRVDGINERYHAKSFVHAELHEENRERKGSPLERDPRRVKRAASPVKVNTAWGRGKKEQQTPASIIKWVVLAIIGLNLLSGLIPMLLF